jgi:hypothetical protein
VMFYLDWNQLYRGDFMLTAFLLLVACMVVMVVATFLFPASLKPEARPLVWEHWTEPLRSPAGAGVADLRVLSALVLGIFVALYALFR